MTTEALKEVIAGVLRERILFIGGPGEGVPANHDHPKGNQLYIGCPNDLIAELAAAVETLLEKTSDY